MFLCLPFPCHLLQKFPLSPLQAFSFSSASLKTPPSALTEEVFEQPTNPSRGFSAPISPCVCCHFHRVRLCDSSVHGILQARILEWVALPSCRGSSWPRDPTSISMYPVLADRFFTTSVTWEALPETKYQHQKSKAQMARWGLSGHGGECRGQQWEALAAFITNLLSICCIPCGPPGPSSTILQSSHLRLGRYYLCFTVAWCQERSGNYQNHMAKESWDQDRKSGACGLPGPALPTKNPALRLLSHCWEI